MDLARQLCDELPVEGHPEQGRPRGGGAEAPIVVPRTAAETIASQIEGHARDHDAGELHRIGSRGGGRRLEHAVGTPAQEIPPREPGECEASIGQAARQEDLQPAAEQPGDRRPDVGLAAQRRVEPDPLAGSRELSLEKPADLP